jgi:uncharacterized protein YbaR (Trm112 family)
MLINCPNCSGPLFKTRNEVIQSMEMSLKCPHCRKLMELHIKSEIVVIVNGKKIEKLGDPKLIMM